LNPVLAGTACTGLVNAGRARTRLAALRLSICRLCNVEPRLLYSAFARPRKVPEGICPWYDARNAAAKADDRVQPQRFIGSSEAVHAGSRLRDWDWRSYGGRRSADARADADQDAKDRRGQRRCQRPSVETEFSVPV
jgi:hypothetical protein